MVHVQVTRRKQWRRGLLHSCECWLLLVNIITDVIDAVATAVNIHFCTFLACLRAQIAISGLSRLLCMQQERQLRRRQKSSATGSHVTRGRLKIRSPALPFTKWEPPPYQPRASPTDDGDVARRPDRDHAANHCDSGPVRAPAVETGQPAVHSHRPRVSVVDATGVVVHRSLATKHGSGRRRPRGEEGATAGGGTTKKAELSAAPRRRDRPPRRPPGDCEPPGRVSAPAHPLGAAVHDSIVCNYVDPAQPRHDQRSPSPQTEVDQKQPRKPGHPAASQPSTAVDVPIPSGIEVGLAVETEVREVKRMLRSFMAKFNRREGRAVPSHNSRSRMRSDEVDFLRGPRSWRS